eukprot:8877866-Karenia_brevis.AAC.1
MHRVRTGQQVDPDTEINLYWMRARSTYEWLIPVVFPFARESTRRSKRKQRMIKSSHRPGVAQPAARTREAARMRDTQRMLKASPPGAPPGATAVRRYPDLPVYSVSEYESRQEHLRETRERHQMERFEDHNRMREEIGMPLRPRPSTRADLAPQPPTPLPPGASVPVTPPRPSGSAAP